MDRRPEDLARTGLSTSRRSRYERWRSFGARLFANAMEDNLQQIKAFGAHHVKNPECEAVLDLGCGDGTNLLFYAPPGARLFGVDGSAEALTRAAREGIRVQMADLDGSIGFPDGSFWMVTSNQVFEHVTDTDNFLAECYRLLTPGGAVIISTENLSSWHNIAALALGWQAFSLTNVSTRAPAIGNPAGLLRAADPPDNFMNQHRRVFAHRGLRELLLVHGFVNVAVRGAGYYPFPSRVARRDPRHAAFLIGYGSKPE